MPVIDFREIPEAHIASGEQDRFELFARDFFVEVLKFNVLSAPNRGADGGKDLLLEEHQTGPLSETKITWLVSCKHKAHSGNSVALTEEVDIGDKLEQFKAQGFIGFYSTLPSGGLNTKLDSIRSKCLVEVFDKERIEKSILDSKSYELFRRYFPVSYKKWVENESNLTPTMIFDEYKPLPCCICGRDLLCVDNPDERYMGMIGFALDPKTNRYIDAYSACKGKCDRIMRARYRSQNYSTAWEDIGDMSIPTIYLRKCMALANQLYSGRHQFSEESFNNFKKILIILSQLVFRHQSKKELERIDDLSELPDGV